MKSIAIILLSLFFSSILYCQELKTYSYVPIDKIQGMWYYKNDIPVNIRLTLGIEFIQNKDLIDTIIAGLKDQLPTLDFFYQLDSMGRYYLDSTGHINVFDVGIIKRIYKEDTFSEKPESMSYLLYSVPGKDTSLLMIEPESKVCETMTVYTVNNALMLSNDGIGLKFVRDPSEDNIPIYWTESYRTHVRDSISRAHKEEKKKIEAQIIVEEHDFGKLNEGEVYSYNHVIYNNGPEPLIIMKVQASCSCVSATGPQEPIPIGGSAEIEISYNSRGKGKKEGRNERKRITLTTNRSPAQRFINIYGVVYR